MKTSKYETDAVELHELYKQRSISETWIEQVNGHTMDGTTLTDYFWANEHSLATQCFGLYPRR